MANDRIEIRTTISKDELDGIINIELIKLKVGIKGIFLRGILKYLEERLQEIQDDKMKEKCREKIIAIQKILGTL